MLLLWKPSPKSGTHAVSTLPEVVFNTARILFLLRRRELSIPSVHSPFTHDPKATARNLPTSVFSTSSFLFHTSPLSNKPSFSTQDNTVCYVPSVSMSAFAFLLRRLFLLTNSWIHRRYVFGSQYIGGGASGCNSFSQSILAANLMTNEFVLILPPRRHDF